MVLIDNPILSSASLTSGPVVIVAGFYPGDLVASSSTVGVRCRPEHGQSAAHLAGRVAEESSDIFEVTSASTAAQIQAINDAAAAAQTLDGGAACG